jgi:hypothetical protein
MHEEAAYEGLDPIECEVRRRSFWLLFGGMHHHLIPPVLLIVPSSRQVNVDPPRSTNLFAG